EFPNPQRVLRPGQFGRVRAVTEEVPDAILVPQMAVQDLQGAKTVMVVGDDSKEAMRTVTLRQPYKDFYIVGSGLKPGHGALGVPGSSTPTRRPRRVVGGRPPLRPRPRPLRRSPPTPAAPAAKPKSGS